MSECEVLKLLRQDVSVSIIDIVTTSRFSLYDELLTTMEVSTSPDGTDVSFIYAVTMRLRFENSKWLLDSWRYPLAIGQILPTLPIWLNDKQAVGLELESAYEETCKALRIR